MYKSIKLVPADGSTLTNETPRHTNMVSLDGKVSIKFVGKICYLHTEKGRHLLKASYNGTVYYCSINKWYVCFNGAELSWKLQQ